MYIAIHVNMSIKSYTRDTTCRWDSRKTLIVVQVFTVRHAAFFCFRS